MKTSGWRIVAAVLLGGVLWFVANIRPVPMCYTPKTFAAATGAADWSHAVVQFLSDHGRLPSTLRERMQPDRKIGDEPYLGREPIDPWGNDYVFATTDSRGWMIVSFGADGKPGGVDDAADIVSAHLPRRR